MAENTHHKYQSSLGGEVVAFSLVPYTFLFLTEF